MPFITRALSLTRIQKWVVIVYVFLWQKSWKTIHWRTLEFVNSKTIFLLWSSLHFEPRQKMFLQSLWCVMWFNTWDWNGPPRMMSFKVSLKRNSLLKKCSKKCHYVAVLSEDLARTFLSWPVQDGPLEQTHHENNFLSHMFHELYFWE